MKKGSKHSKETCLKMKESAKGRIMPPLTEEHKKKLRESNLKTWSNPNIIKRHKKIVKQIINNRSEEEKKLWYENMVKACRTPEKKEKSRQIILKLRQDPEWMRKSIAGRKGRVSSFKGKHHTIESRIKNSQTKKNSPLTPRGPKNPAWIDGLGEKRRGERLTFHQTLEYRLFREAVLKRDDYTCQICGKRGVRLHVDHIKSYRKYPELRTDINNGRVVCFPCHKETPNYGRKEDYA
jgi:hypothetical protein